MQPGRYNTEVNRGQQWCPDPLEVIDLYVLSKTSPPVANWAIPCPAANVRLAEDTSVHAIDPTYQQQHVTCL
jgi:hypothetical protein